MKRAPKPPPFAVSPPVSDIAQGKLGIAEFEDTLPLAVTFDHVLSKAEKATLQKLYTAWTGRIVKESRAADDSGEDFTRFDALFVGDKAIQGGAARFVAAHASCLWLVNELAKTKGVVAVTFGDPPEAGAPLASAATTEPPPEIAALELVHEGRRHASLCFTLAFYAVKPLQASPRAVLAAWEAFLALGARDALRLWGTETTAPIKKKAVTAATLGTLGKWLAKGAPKREYLAFEADSGPTYQDAPRWKFQVWSQWTERKDAHFVRMSIPFQLGVDRADAMAKLAADLFATGAFRSGLAGPCWEFGTFSSYLRDENGHDHACRLAERYPAIDLAEVINDALSVGVDGIKNVGWLTFLDDAFAREVGATGERVGEGIMIRASAKPTLDGKVEAKIVAQLAPLVARTLPRLQRLDTSADDELHTTAFRLRLAPWPELATMRGHAGVGQALLRAAQQGDVEGARATFGRCLDALAALQGLTLGKTTIDAPEMRRALVASRIREIFQYVAHACAAATANAKRDPERGKAQLALAVEMASAAVALPDAPAALYATLVERGTPYVFSGLLPTALAAKDRASLERHVDAAAKRAHEEPAIHHVLARAFVFLGDHERAVDHVELAQGTWEDAKEMKTEAPLAALAKHPRFLAAFKKKR